MKCDDTQTSQPAAPDSFIDTPELLRRLPISRRTLFAHRERGLIPHIILGRRVIYDWPTVRESLLRQQSAANSR